MAPPKDIARSYPKRGLTADVGFRSEPTFCSDGAIEFEGYGTGSGGGPFINYSLNKTFSAFTVASWVLIDGNSTYNYFMQAGGSGSFGGMVHFGWINGTTNPQLRLQDGKRSIAYIPSQTFPEVVNQWCHVACTINSAGDSIKMYVNGIEATGLTQPTSGNEIEMPGSDGSSIGHFNVGSFQYSATKQTLGIGGKMANFGLYDAELTQDQIIQLMRGNDFATCSAVATPAVFFELFENNTDSTGNAGTITDTGTPYYGYSYAQLPRGLDLTRGAAQARCFTGRAVDFDGSTDFLDMGNGVDKNYTTRSDRASFSVWFNTDTTSVVGFLYQNRAQVGGTDRPECETHLFISPSTGLGFDGEGASVLIPLSNIKVGVWHHFVGVADDSDGPVKAYLDGVLYDTTSAAQAGANGSTFTIGARNNTPLQPFNGKLSNFKIFNVELTQAQVLELYHNPETVIPTGVSASNLRRHYPLCAFNDTSGFGGRYESDQGVEGVNGEYGGSPVMSFAQPVPCPQLGLQQSAMRLYHPGANQGAAATITAPGTTVSLSAWIFWDQARTSYPIALGTVTNATDSFNIRINGAGQITLYQNAEYLSGLTITEGGWNHIVFATRSDSPYWRCWLNNSEASSPAVANVTNITSTDCRLGMNSSNFGMGGIANDAAVWNTELGDSDVAALYNSGVQGMDVGTVQASNLKGWWKFDDLTTLKDYSGNGANATVTGTFAAASFPENASGSTIVGDFSMKRKGVSILNHAGADDATAIIPAQEAVYPKAGAANGYTIGFCYRKIKDGTAMIYGNTGSSTNDQFMCFQQTGNTLRFNLGDGSIRPEVVSSTITDSDWHHYTLTISYATTPATVKIYIDGAVDLSTTKSITGPPALHPMHLGTGLFDGQGPVGCFKFYQVALSADEVERLAFSDLRLIKGLQNV